MSDESTRRLLKLAGFRTLADNSNMPKVKGYCPMGCGQTLVHDSGEVVCTDYQCPRPWASTELLNDPETGHVVDLDEHGFTVRHPLRERLDDELLSCDLHEWLVCNRPPVQLGLRYRVAGNPGDAHAWTPLDIGEET